MFFLRLVPDSQDVAHTSVYLAQRVVRQTIVHEPLVKPYLSPVVGDSEHIILVGTHYAVSHSLSSFG